MFSLEHHSNNGMNVKVCKFYLSERSLTVLVSEFINYKSYPSFVKPFSLPGKRPYFFIVNFSDSFKIVCLRNFMN